MAGWLTAKYPGRIGRLYTPTHIERILQFPFAVDNGAYVAHVKRIQWNEDGFWKILKNVWLSGRKPLWIAVPDVVANAEETIKRWHEYKDRVCKYGPLAFVVQDGMTISDVPNGVENVFVGGTTDWKWKTATMWCSKFKTHIGRVSSPRRLEIARKIGAASIDGSGWFRNPFETAKLEAFLDGAYSNQMELNGK